MKTKEMSAKRQASSTQFTEHFRNSAEYEEASQQAIELARKSLRGIKGIQVEKKEKKPSL